MCLNLNFRTKIDKLNWLMNLSYIFWLNEFKNILILRQKSYSEQILVMQEGG